LISDLMVSRDGAFFPASNFQIACRLNPTCDSRSAVFSPSRSLTIRRFLLMVFRMITVVSIQRKEIP